LWDGGSAAPPIPQECHPLPLQDSEASRDKPGAGGGGGGGGLIRKGRSSALLGSGGNKPLTLALASQLAAKRRASARN
jgi:hypothetical protein